MNRVTDTFLKISKVIVFALFSVQYIYAVWWVINNIGVIPDFAIPSESFLYNQIVLFIGKGFFVLYLLQAIALYFGIKALVSDNQWVARFTITNPLILQFVFSLTPDVFALSIVLALLGDLIRKEKLKSKHAFFLVFLGILHSRYFLIGFLIILVMEIAQRVLIKNNREELDRKQKISRTLAIIQVLLVFALVILSYQTQNNMNDQVVVQKEMMARFTIDESVPSQHSIGSVAKGLVEDTVIYAFTPFYSTRIIDDLRLTQNSWNYINFTREVPVWSRAFMDLTERNMIIAGLLFVVSLFVYFIFVKEKKKIVMFDGFFVLCTLAICFLLAITSKRGVDYRNGIFIIPIWYAFIITFYENIFVWKKTEEQIKS